MNKMTLMKKQESIRDYKVMRRTTCCNCPTGCGLKVFIKGSTLVDIYGDEEHPVNKGAVCPKGLLSYFHLRNPSRIINPRIRESISEPFKVVSWPEALSFTAKRIKDVSEEKGKASVYIHGDECSPFDYLAGANIFAKHFGTPNIPSRFYPLPFSHHGLINKMFGIPGVQCLMNASRDWCNSKCILLYRCDLAATDPITFGPIIDARDRGATILVIDSKRTTTASRATLSLRVKPGSEPSALKGILHFLIQKGLLDEGFLKDSTDDFSSLKSEVEPFTPQRVAESCWIKREDLEKFAYLIGSVKPFQIIAGDWFSRHYLSDEDLLMCGALVCSQGSVGIPGGGLNLLNVSPFHSGGHFVADDKNLRTDEPSNGPLCLNEILLHKTKSVGALLWHNNPCAGLAAGKRTKVALTGIPLVVHFSSYPNESFHYSHVSFPVSSWLEYAGLLTNNNGRSIQWHHRVIDPPGECRSPFDIWSDLAQVFDGEESFPWKGKDGLVNADKAADFFLKQNPLTRAASVEKIDPEKNQPGGLLWPCVEEADLLFEKTRFIKGNIRGRNILFQRGQNYPLTESRFPTKGGRKISFSCLKEIQGTADPGLANAPSDIGEDGACLHEKSPRLPLLLVTGMVVDFVEEYGYFVSDRDDWTRDIMIQLHPQLGGILGVGNGENLIVENERGGFVVPAWLSDDVDPRVVWCPGGVDPYQPHFSGESPYSLFEVPTSSERCRPFTMVTVYKPGGDKEKSRAQIIEFLKRFETGI